MVFHWFYNKNENLCYHGTGSEERAREAARGQQKGMSVPEHGNIRYVRPNAIEAVASTKGWVPQGGTQARIG